MMVQMPSQGPDVNPKDVRWAPWPCDWCEARFTSLGLWSIHVNPASGKGCKRAQVAA